MLLQMLFPPRSEQEQPTLLGTLALDDGGELRYLGYSDGVYEQTVDPQGRPRLMRQYECWSMWPRSAAAVAIAVAARYNLDGTA